jgi:AraC-like DNA-binding protein
MILTPIGTAEEKGEGLLFRKWGIFRRLFVSYMVITLFPVTVLFVMLYQNSVVNLRSEVESFSISNMYKIRDLMDDRIREWKSISLLISLNPKLSPYNMSKEDYQTLEGIAELAKYKAGNTFISDILLWYKNDSSRLISSTGTISIDALLELSYRFSAEDRKQFTNDINTLKLPMMKRFADSDTMTYMVPLPVNGGAYNGTAIFIFKGTAIRNMISGGRTEYQGATLLLDANNNEILTVDNNGLLGEEGLLPFVKATFRPGIHVADYKQRSLSIISVLSEETGWAYVTVIPTRQFQERVTSQEIFIIVCTLIVLFLCAAAAFTLAVGNYRPIRKLSTLIQHHRLPADPSGGNELDHIGQAFGTAMALNQSLTNQLDTHRLLLRQDVLLRLLKGEAGSREEWSRLMQSCDMHLAGPYYAVLLVYYEPEEEEAAKLNGKLLDFISHTYSGEGRAYAVEPGNGNSIAIVASIMMADGHEELLELAGKLLDLYGEPLRSRVAVGIGRIYDDLLFIHHSYIEAHASIEQRIVLRDRQVIPFEEIVTFPQLYWQSAEDEMYWVQSLKQGDRNLAYEALRRIVTDIEAKQMPDSLVRFTCNKLADLAIQAIQQATREFAANRKEALQLGDVMMNVIHFTSLAEFERHMKALIDGICDHIGMIHEQREQGLVSHIVSYMEENYAAADLSLERIAEQFGYSNYYWSRFFKEKIGCHFSDFLWQLRVREAKRQFVTTTKTLKEIIVDVGYHDLSSFSRRFKGEEGITPGQYRKLYADSGGTEQA